MLSNFVKPSLTDWYQISMVYAYWKNKRHNDYAVFDTFFRKNPFGGEFTIFAGLAKIVELIENFHFTDEDIEYIRKKIPQAESNFFEWLKSVDCSEIEVRSIPEGTVVFPKETLIRISGPLGVGQLIETVLLNQVNFPSLVTTNAARHKMAAGMDKKCLEFGLRRSQGSDGAMTASEYSYMGGFDGTSNVLAGILCDVPVSGTHAHAYVQSFTKFSDLYEKTLITKDGEEVDFLDLVLAYRRLIDADNTNEGELAAFVAYAQAYPEGFLALVDTYDTLRSGVQNFAAVALALNECGYKPIGIRLDSGDLALLSKKVREYFVIIDDLVQSVNKLEYCTIVASNDINEKVLRSLNEQGHEIDAYGIGTNLVTCEAQPALGCVYKLVEINGMPRIKISQDLIKITIPGKKKVFRFYNKGGVAILDLMMQEDEKIPVPNESIICYDPFKANKRLNVYPTRVEELHFTAWDGKTKGKKMNTNIHEKRDFVIEQLQNKFKKDHLRSLNPTPYEVMVSEKLYNYVHDLIRKESAIPEIR